MRILIVLFLTLVNFTLDAQKLSRGVKNLVREIEAYNELEGQHVGYSGTTTVQYRNFEKLENAATQDELLSLLHYKNSVVKGYASWALADNKYPKLHEILSMFLSSGEKVKTQHGCIISTSELSSEFYYRVYSKIGGRNVSQQDSLFYAAQLLQMDSVLLYTDKENYLTDIALRNNKANPKTYSRIKQLAMEKDASAYVAFAEYRKQEDIPFFLNLGRRALGAIAVFPDPAFWGMLADYKDSDKSFSYFLAVASYKNDSALSLLNQTYATCDSVQVNSLAEALCKRYCPLYQDLLLRIWEEHKTIDLTTTQKLVADCPGKASIAFAKGLQSDGDFNLLQFDYNYGSSDHILPLMLQTISTHNKELMLDVCNKNISTAKFTALAPFLIYIEKNKVTETTPTLLARLDQKNFAYEIFHITQTLLSFKDAETNKKLPDILNKHQEEWDWGNWSASFRKMFDENGISIK